VLLELLTAELVLVVADASPLELLPPDETLELVEDWPPAPIVAELEEASPGSSD
jgi:hypothetical protein